ncbi:hypothetical protein DPEC_G00117250 [Dallia pectoralis]|uniref:Uncharacterized protein n=1 Tax=Dallia pectoralis TaxID=75939 RepID=A0ACC2GUL7_DALPE|nr:hypothetical protein DPEC_G00117250 [Dallia pectoralis]
MRPQVSYSGPSIHPTRGEKQPFRNTAPGQRSVDPHRKAQSLDGWREFRSGQNICWDLRKLSLIQELRVTLGTFGREQLG